MLWNDQPSSNPSISRVYVIGESAVVALVLMFRHNMLSAAALFVVSHDAAPLAAMSAVMPATLLPDSSLIVTNVFSSVEPRVNEKLM